MSMFPVTCAACGAKVMGATFCCLVAWCSTCWPLLGHALICRLSDDVEAKLRPVREKMFRESAAAALAKAKAGPVAP